MTEVQALAKLLIPEEDFLSLRDFSYKFNAAITYINENNEVIEILENQYIDPVTIRVFNNAKAYHLLYYIDQIGNLIHKSIEPIVYIPEIKDSLNSIAKKLIEIFQNSSTTQDFKDKIMFAAKRLQKPELGHWEFLESLKTIHK
jgi:hypothetical protein